MKNDLRNSFGQHVDEYKSKGLEPISASKGEEMKNRLRQRHILNVLRECSTI
jgi:hypothetical protein